LSNRAARFSAIPKGDLFSKCLVGFEKQTSVSDEHFFLFRSIDAAGDAVFDTLLHLDIHLAKIIAKLKIVGGNATRTRAMPVFFVMSRTSSSFSIQHSAE